MKRIIFIILVFTFFTSVPISATIHDGNVRVSLDQMTIRESIAGLSRIFDMEIVLISNISKISQTRVSLELEQATLEQAVKEVMRKANVQNHALFIDREKKSVQVWILSAAARKVIENKAKSNMIPENEMEPLTLEQMRLLAQNSQALSELDEKPLTPQQMELLQEQSAELEAEMEESTKPLTTDQIDQLKKQSILIEAEMEEAQRPLTANQMEQLRLQSFEIESESKSDLQPLSQDQMLLLKEQKQEY